MTKTSKNLFKIKNLLIGVGQPCRIIAELGTLHNYSYKSLTENTKRCVNAGADMVKVQFIDPTYAWWASKKAHDRYISFYQPELWPQYLFSMNQLYENPIFASVFDPHSPHNLKDVSPCFKIAYKMTNCPSIYNEIIDTNLPIIVSTNHLKNNSFFENKNGQPMDRYFIKQYVIPDYPTKPENILLPQFGIIYHGASLHTNSFIPLKSAIMSGAKTLEIHVQGDDAEGPDTEFALRIKDLEELVSWNRKVWKDGYCLEWEI